MLEESSGSGIIVSMENSLSVLVIDDEVSLEVVYRNFLTKIGAKVTFCDHPQKGWRAIDKETFDLIITDLKMPVITGDEFVSIVRASKLNHHTPVILCSAFINKLVMTEMTRESKVYFLTKPFDSKALLELVHKTVGVKKVEGSPLAEISSHQVWLDSFVAKLTALTSEKIDVKLVDKFDVWNFESINIQTCYSQGNEVHNITMLMMLKTFLKVAGLIQGTQYREIENEALERWQNLLLSVMKGTARATFSKVLGQEMLSQSGQKALLCRIHSLNIDILIYIN